MTYIGNLIVESTGQVVRVHIFDGKLVREVETIDHHGDLEVDYEPLDLNTSKWAHPADESVPAAKGSNTPDIPF